MPNTEIQQLTKQELSTFIKRVSADLKSKIDLTFGTNVINYLPSLPTLGECACSTQQIFNRLQKDNHRRDEIENTIIDNVKRRLPTATYPTLNYFSLGSGYLLQDYMVCIKLLQEGYSLNIFLVEPRECKELEAAKATFIQQLSGIAKNLNLDVKISHFLTVDHFISQHNETIHVAHAIDFEFNKDTVNELLKSHYLLNENGLLFISIGMYDWIFSKNELVDEKTHKPLLPALRELFTEKARQEVSFVAKSTLVFNQGIKHVEEQISHQTGMKDQRVLRNILSYGDFFHVPIPREFEEEMERITVACAAQKTLL